MKHADFVHLHNSLVGAFLLGLALVGVMTSEVPAGTLEQAFKNAKVLQRFETDGYVVRQAFVEDNTVACMLGHGDTTTIRAWDLEGNLLWSIDFPDTLPPDGSPGPVWEWLISVSADGRRFATIRTGKCLIIDRSGNVVRAMSLYGIPELSPKAKYLMVSPDESSEGSTDFLLSSIERDSIMMGPDRPLGDNSFATFLSDSLVAVNARAMQGIFHLPDGRKLAEIPSIQISSFGEDHGVYATVSLSGDKAAVMADTGCIVFSVTGKMIWRAGFGARAGTFDSSGEWLCVAVGLSSSMRLVWHGFFGDTSSFSVGPVPMHPGNWWYMSMVTPLSLSPSQRLIVARGYEGTISVMVLVDLSARSLLGAYELKGGVHVVPKHPDQFVRIEADRTGHDALELIGIDLSR